MWLEFRRVLFRSQKQFCESNNMTYKDNGKCLMVKDSTAIVYPIIFCSKEFSREHEYCFESYAGNENNLKWKKK